MRILPLITLATLACRTPENPEKESVGDVDTGEVEVVADSDVMAVWILKMPSQKTRRVFDSDGDGIGDDLICSQMMLVTTGITVRMSPMQIRLISMKMDWVMPVMMTSMVMGLSTVK